MKSSETIVIKRSQIRLNPCNPKRHTDKQIAQQKSNIKKVGFLGGIVWNRQTGNLIDGHRRVMALDLIHKYDGSQNDYDIKVEVVDFDEKQEKSQLTYMALGNTKADYQLIAEYLPDIDYSIAGLDDYDIAQIQAFIPSAADVQVESYDDLISKAEKTADDTQNSVDVNTQNSAYLDRGNSPEQNQPVENPTETIAYDNSEANTEPKKPLSADDKKAAVKEAKAAAREKAVENFKDLTAYVTISFANAEQKRVFCELAEIAEDEAFISGEKVLEMIN